MKMFFLPPEQIPEGAHVLMPFVLNHLVGRNAPLQGQEGLWRWLEAARSRASGIVIADIPADEGGSLWPSVQGGLGIAEQPTTARFPDHVQPFASAFEDAEQGRRRCAIKYPKFAKATCLVGDSRGWRFVP